MEEFHRVLTRLERFPPVRVVPLGSHFRKLRKLTLKDTHRAAIDQFLRESVIDECISTYGIIV